MTQLTDPQTFSMPKNNEDPQVLYNTLDRYTTGAILEIRKKHVSNTSLKKTADKILAERCINGQTLKYPQERHMTVMKIKGKKFSGIAALYAAYETDRMRNAKQFNERVTEGLALIELARLVEKYLG